jgi:hypothetical protein
MTNLGQWNGYWGLVLVEFCRLDSCDWGIRHLLVVIGTLSETLGVSYGLWSGPIFSCPASNRIHLLLGAGAWQVVVIVGKGG